MHTLVWDLYARRRQAGGMQLELCLATVVPDRRPHQEPDARDHAGDFLLRA